MYKKLVSLPLLLSFAISGASAGVLTGDMVNVSHRGPYVGNVYQNTGTQAIPGGGFASYLYDGGTYRANVYEDYVELIFTCSGCNWTDWSFLSGGTKTNAVGIKRLSSAAFTGVSIDPTTSYSGFNASRLSFTSNEILVELKGLSIGNQYIKLNLQGATVAPTVQAAAVPEPESLALALVALVAAGVARRRQPR